MFFSWKELRKTEGICSDGLEEVISKLGGDGITLEQARKACKGNIFPLSDAARAATALRLPNWEKALGKVVAHTHPKAKDYYEDEVIYLHNQKALEEGRLIDINEIATRTAVRAADAAYWAVVGIAGRTAGADYWASAKAARAARDAAKAARAADAAEWAARDAAEAADEVDELIDIYFDTLEEACE